MAGYAADAAWMIHRAAQRDPNKRLAGLLRDIFGNPFRPASIIPAWLTPTISSLATAAYEERAPSSSHLNKDRLAMLADALEEAGCSEEALLEHLRGPGPHVRGCFALDAIVGKQ
jgi:hypothetical protein